MPVAVPQHALRIRRRPIWKKVADDGNQGVARLDDVLVPRTIGVRNGEVPSRDGQAGVDQSHGRPDALYSASMRSM